MAARTGEVADEGTQTGFVMKNGVMEYWSDGNSNRSQYSNTTNKPMTIL